MNIYDLVIIGGGPIGLACALEAEKKKLSYVILEKGTIANSLYHYPLYMRFFSSADRLEIDGVPFITIAPKLQDRKLWNIIRELQDKEISISVFMKK